jgi:hypothetical protein
MPSPGVIAAASTSALGALAVYLITRWNNRQKGTDGRWIDSI